MFSLWLAIPLNLSFFTRVQKLTPYDGLSSWVFLIAIAMLLVAFFNLVLNLLLWRWNAKILIFVLLVLGAAGSYVNSNFGLPIDAYQIQNAVETDASETKDLMSSSFFIALFYLVVLPALFFLSRKIKASTFRYALRDKLLSAVLSLMVIAGLAFVYYVDLASIFRGNRELKGFISPQNMIASSWSYYKKLAPKKDQPLVAYGRDAKIVPSASSTNNTLPKVMVFVLGETARAESFSLNGYSKNTNPELSQLPIINFSQVSSCGTATAVSVPCMMSGMPRDDYDSKLARHRENLLDILQHAGYKVTWVNNNSGCKEVCNRVIKYEIPETLKQKWCKDGECYDDILVDSLKDIIHNIETSKTTQPQVIVLHQMGSHGPAYYKRSRDEYQKFKPFCNTNEIQGCSQQELVNAYDNSIVYTDHIVAELIHILDGQKQYSTALWYMSDHGESTGEHGLYLHGAPYMLAPSQQTHVPMVMWLSPQWQTQQPKLKSCLTAQKDHKISQDSFFPTMLSMLDVQSATKPAKYDLLQQCP